MKLGEVLSLCTFTSGDLHVIRYLQGKPDPRCRTIHLCDGLPRSTEKCTFRTRQFYTNAPARTGQRVRFMLVDLFGNHYYANRRCREWGHGDGCFRDVLPTEQPERLSKNGRGWGRDTTPVVSEINLRGFLHDVLNEGDSKIPYSHQSITLPLQVRLYEMFIQEVPWKDGRPSLLGFGSFLTPYTPPSFDHGYKVPTTDASGCYSLLTECGRQGRESREGTLECYAGQSRFWHRQRYPHNDQSKSSPSLWWTIGG